MCSKCKGGRTTDVLCSTYVCPLRMERTEEEEKEEKKKNKLASISPLNPQISHCRVQTFFRFSTYHHWMPASNAQSALLTSSPDVYRHQSGTGNKDCRPETRVLYLTKVPASVGTKDNPFGDRIHATKAPNVLSVPNNRPGFKPFSLETICTGSSRHEVQYYPVHELGPYRSREKLVCTTFYLSY